jgi:hypothetical protein
LQIKPLGAGDLVDRSIRHYRNNLGVFLSIAGPPVVAGAVFSLLWRMALVALFGKSVESDDDAMLFQVLVWMGSSVIWFAELVLILTVMGGASLNFVRHLAFAEPVSFADTYRAVWNRFRDLLAAALMISVVGVVAGAGLSYSGLIAVAFAAIAAAAVFGGFPLIAFLVGVVVAVAVVFLIGWVFFLVVSRIAFIPQTMLVEDATFGSAVSRSISMAKGGTGGLASLTVFAVLASYSALALLYIPILWYAWLTGIEAISFDGSVAPLWFELSGQLVGQTSLLITIPVLMIGMSLLYVDRRVTHEGYDIELMAARELGEVPRRAERRTDEVPA